MLRNTSGKLYSVAAAGAVIAAVHIALMLAGSIDSNHSDRTIKLIGSQFNGLELELTAPMPSAWAASPCRSCDRCGESGEPTEHLVFADPLAKRSHAAGAVDHLDECWLTNGTCDQWHPMGCDVTLAEAAPDLTSLWQRLATGIPATDIVRVVQEWPTLIELNSQRAAIQVVGCDGHIIAHLPISGDDVRTLEALLE